MNKEVRKLIEDGIEAFHLTREYVGFMLLPNHPGWAHYDWVVEAMEFLTGKHFEVGDEVRVKQDAKMIVENSILGTACGISTYAGMKGMVVEVIDDESSRFDYYVQLDRYPSYPRKFAACEIEPA